MAIKVKNFSNVWLQSPNRIWDNWKWFEEFEEFETQLRKEYDKGSTPQEAYNNIFNCESSEFGSAIK